MWMFCYRIVQVIPAFYFVFIPKYLFSWQTVISQAMKIVYQIFILMYSQNYLSNKVLFPSRAMLKNYGLQISFEIALILYDVIRHRIGHKLFLNHLLTVGNLLQTLEHGGFTSLCKMDNIFLTTHDAVNFAYLKYHVSGCLLSIYLAHSYKWGF